MLNVVSPQCGAWDKDLVQLVYLGVDPREWGPGRRLREPEKKGSRKVHFCIWSCDHWALFFWVSWKAPRIVNLQDERQKYNLPLLSLAGWVLPMCPIFQAETLNSVWIQKMWCGYQRLSVLQVDICSEDQPLPCPTPIQPPKIWRASTSSRSGRRAFFLSKALLPVPTPTVPITCSPDGSPEHSGLHIWCSFSLGTPFLLCLQHFPWPPRNICVSVLLLLILWMAASH